MLMSKREGEVGQVFLWGSLSLNFVHHFVLCIKHIILEIGIFSYIWYFLVSILLIHWVFGSQFSFDLCRCRCGASFCIPWSSEEHTNWADRDSCPELLDWKKWCFYWRDQASDLLYKLRLSVICYSCTPRIRCYFV